MAKLARKQEASHTEWPFEDEHSYKAISDYNVELVKENKKRIQCACNNPKGIMSDCES